VFELGFLELIFVCKVPIFPEFPLFSSLKFLWLLGIFVLPAILGLIVVDGVE
jgi:hypothetical protein